MREQQTILRAWDVTPAGRALAKVPGHRVVCEKDYWPGRPSQLLEIDVPIGEEVDLLTFEQYFGVPLDQQVEAYRDRWKMWARPRPPRGVFQKGDWFQTPHGRCVLMEGHWKPGHEDYSAFIYDTSPTYVERGMVIGDLESRISWPWLFLPNSQDRSRPTSAPQTPATDWALTASTCSAQPHDHA